MKRVPLLAAAIALVSLAPQLKAGDEPYCGIYCAFAALRANGSTLEFSRLIEQRYVPSERGSSLENLCQAIQENGGHALPLSGLGEGALQAAEFPIILHIRRPGYRSQFSHWILYLGAEGDNARIIDPPGTVQVLPYADILAVFDGTAVAVSREPLSAMRIRFGDWLVVAAIATVAIAALFAIRGLVPQNRRWAGPVSLAAATILVAVLYHTLAPSGFLQASAATGQIAHRHFEPVLTEVDLDNVAKGAKQSDTTLIDCRLESAYERGHIAGAINLPISANMAERAHVLAKIPTERRIVVYCQSEYCNWSRELASDLYFRGYSHVVVFRGGWREWVQRATTHSARLP